MFVKAPISDLPRNFAEMPEGLTYRILPHNESTAETIMLWKQGDHLRAMSWSSMLGMFLSVTMDADEADRIFEAARDRDCSLWIDRTSTTAP